MEVYKNKIELLKFDSLKVLFEKNWNDSANCYLKPYYSPCQNCLHRKILDYKISNIFHSNGYDTLAVLVSYYIPVVDEKNNESNKITVTELEKITIDNGKWNFRCVNNQLAFIKDGKHINRNRDVNTYCHLIRKWSYFKSDGTWDTGFFTDCFTRNFCFRENILII